MTTTAKIGPQDLPPKGGYKPFQIDRVKLRTLLGGTYIDLYVNYTLFLDFST